MARQPKATEVICAFCDAYFTSEGLLPHQARTRQLGCEGSGVPMPYETKANAAKRPKRDWREDYGQE